MRRELQRIAIGTFTGPTGTFRQLTDIPKTAKVRTRSATLGKPNYAEPRSEGGCPERAGFIQHEHGSSLGSPR
jgi:hypothetical protein